MQKKEPPYIPQEGEVVTWKQNNHLIVKAKLGERRKHIVNEHCPKCERDFYKPEREHYLGQFPIDYKPEKFSEISVVEAESLPLPYSDGQLEFDLILNGSTVQATDRSIYSEQGLDNKDQVKVRIFNEKFNSRTVDVYKSYQDSTKDSNFDMVEAKRWSEQYGVNCWFFSKTKSLRCYGQSSHEKSMGILFKHMGGEGNWIFAESWEPLYGGITIRWNIDKRNFHRWKDVDAAIWRLLETWNVSSLHKNIEEN
ncbi:MULTISPECIES: hypothetical protein [Acinetobacter]|nr:MULTISPECIES: hypothetical protein [Acinetobacter]